MTWSPRTQLHSLLARQLKRHLEGTDAVPDTWQPFLDAVNEAYRQSDTDREMIERSLDLSSQELLQANAEMRALIAKLEDHEEQQAHLIQELEVKNQELEQFMNAVTHDLKSPMVTIRGFLPFVEQAARAGDVERLEEDLQRIQTAAAQMSQILEELSELTLIGRVTHEQQALSLHEVVREAADLVAGKIIEKGVEVTVDADLPMVVGQRPSLLRVFQNLIENAVKFMGDQAEPHVHVFARYDEGQLVCCVRDNGQGIEPRDREKVFGLFDRLSADDEGTGIGLALVKRVIEAHGGRVWVESEGQGRGSTFCLTLTIPPPPRASAE